MVHVGPRLGSGSPGDGAVRALLWSNLYRWLIFFFHTLVIFLAYNWIFLILMNIARIEDWGYVEGW